jgi:phosphate transport system substrate-binding protein
MVTSKEKFSVSLKFLGALVASASVGLYSAVAIAQSRTSIDIDGSSTVFPITEAIAEEYMTTNPNVNITVGVSGTGGGFKKFCAGETAIANASRAIKQEEIDLCKAAGIEYVQIPVAYDAITVVVNQDNTWLRNITVDELKKLWEPSAEGRITRWNQVNPAFPNEPISLFGPGADSGTFDYFTKEIVGEEGSSRGDYTASEDDNVLVTGVTRNRNALGYFGMSYYLENAATLNAVGVASEDTNNVPVVPSVENITEYKPLARELYIYVSKSAMASRPEVKSFVEFYLQNAETVVPDVSYIPFEAGRYEAALNSL